MSHDGINPTVAQRKDPINNILLNLLYFPVVISFFDDCLNFLFRHLRTLFLSSPNILTVKQVLLDKTHTKGEASDDNRRMGRAMSKETCSGFPIPMRFGTNSPQIKVK